MLPVLSQQLAGSSYMRLITPHGARHPAPAPLPTQVQPEGCQRNNHRRHPLYLLRAGSGTGWGWIEQEQGPWPHCLRPQGMGNPGGQGSGICTPGRESLQTEHTHQRSSRQAQRILTCITEMEKHHRARRAELRRWRANQRAGCGISSGDKGTGQRAGELQERTRGERCDQQGQSSGSKRKRERSQMKGPLLGLGGRNMSPNWVTRDVITES